MAGPGGGGGFSGGGRSSGGGSGFSGGSFGGSFGGRNNGGGFAGGFGGAHHGHHHHHHHHRPFFSPWYHRPVYVYGGRGSGYGLLIVIVVFIAFFALMMFLPGDMYDEKTMEAYADDNYKQLFYESSAPEDNLLIVFLTTEECDSYYTIAWLGDNVNYDIVDEFGEYGAYGSSLRNRVNTSYYAYSLDTDLAAVAGDMTDSITAYGLESCFNDESDRSNLAASRLINRSSLSLSEDIVNKALVAFTEETGIPCVILVDEAEAVFGKDGAKSSDNNWLLILVGAGAVAVVLFVVFSRRTKKKKPAESAEKCGKDGCDGKVDSDTKPPWEY